MLHLKDEKEDGGKTPQTTCSAASGPGYRVPNLRRGGSEVLYLIGGCSRSDRRTAQARA